MNTDWVFEKPIDREHKEYKLLAYFQKMGEKLENMELYPGFIELSLHLANIQTLLKDKKLIYTNKKFNTVDDELLVKDLKIKNLPEMTQEEYEEFIKILTYSAPRIFEYFGFAKAIWETAFDGITIKNRKARKNITSNKGYFYFINKNNSHNYIWEYELKPAAKNSPESKVFVNLIYSDKKNGFTIPKIIKDYSNWFKDDNKNLPVFEMFGSGDFPIEETLLPLFKRKLIGFITQKTLIENYKKNKSETVNY